MLGRLRWCAGVSLADLGYWCSLFACLVSLGVWCERGLFAAVCRGGVCPCLGVFLLVGGAVFLCYWGVFCCCDRECAAG